ncbi:MAG: PAS-domain containing protein [Luminiphilus sp.]|nr:PAS-domain containing protein [Luminiphilus sp.]
MVTNEKDQFLTSLATRAYWLIFSAHFIVFIIMMVRSATDPIYEIPFVTWAVWSVIILGTPAFYFTAFGHSYKFRALLAQALLLISLAFGLANQGLGAVTTFNVPLMALLGTIFFSRKAALIQLSLAILVLLSFLYMKLSGQLSDVANPDWVLNSNYRWVLRIAYIALFSGVIIYFLQQYVNYTFRSVEDLKILQEAVDEAPDAFVVWDKDDRLFMCNRHYRELDQRLKPTLRRGVTFEQTLRTGIQVGMYPDAVGQEDAWVTERLKNHHKNESQKVVKLDGGRWMNVVESRTSSGFLAGFRTDITALRNSQDILQATLDSVSEAVVTISQDGRVINLNSASQQLFGYSLDELKGRNILEIAPDRRSNDLGNRLVAESHSRKIGSTFRNVNTSLKRKNGESFTAKVEVRDVEINGQRVFLTFIKDLTRQFKFESTVQALGSAVEQLAAGIVLLNNVSQITYNNAFFPRLLDLPLGSKIEGLTADELFEVMSQQILRVNIGNRKSAKAQLQDFYKNLSAPILINTVQGRRLSLSVQALEGNNTILTVTDNTEEYERQIQLEQSNKLATLGEMAAGIAHELNQPLQAIKLTANNLMLQARGNKAVPNQKLLLKLGRIDSQVDRAAVITDHMRQSARLANEEQAEADIASVVRDTHLLVESSLRLKSITFRTELAPSLPAGKIHPIRLEQVLLNLINNAQDAINDQKFGQRRPWILLKAYLTGDQTLCLSIEDSAGGIGDDVVDRIFDPFYTTKEVGKGTGLGLSISYGIINDAGGTLSVSNTKHGAKFTITLPT